MSTAHNPIRLFETVVDDCPYLDDQKSASIIVDPEHTIEPELFAMLSRSGFRRSGEMLYSPKCPTCAACVSVRIPVAQFKPSRSQKRVWKKNTDLVARIEDVSFKQEHFDLYLRYQRARHEDSSMCDEDPSKYVAFIESKFSKSKFVCFYLHDELVGISVVDQFAGGLSAVYTFFEPELSDRSLGTYAILYLVRLAQVKDVPYVYLGYWIKESQKMGYKTNFRPLEGYFDRNWKVLR
ncbi:MAG: arginyltransferase [Arenicella sp.]|jgi:arginyl-tRNA--protein-N-Asp/Glu arginylyltransferase|nr:arginyltransferase [Arenicella sp.]HAU68810.1 arginyltransferase [Gammaproteobacteria bacterium]